MGTEAEEDAAIEALDGAGMDVGQRLVSKALRRQRMETAEVDT